MRAAAEHSMVPAEPKTRPKILFFVTEDWFFMSHFVSFARIATELGMEVLLCSSINEKRNELESLGIRLFDIKIARGVLNLFRILRLMLRVRRIIKAEQPEIIHVVSLSLVLTCAVVARFASKGTLVCAATGLGYIWTIDNLATRIGRVVIGWAFRLLESPRTFFFFENVDDARELGVNLDGDRAILLSGSGVELADFPPRPANPSNPLRVAIVARLIRTKGVAEAVAAVRKARAAGYDVVLDIYGKPDSANPSSYTEEDLHAWSREPGIAWHGYTSSPATVWANSDAAILLSWGGEGLPRTLSEAAASARAIITTNVPGCRAVVCDGIEGFLVPPRDVDAAAAAIIRLAQDRTLCAAMGRAARVKFERELAAEYTHGKVRSLYRKLMEQRHSER
ncbi:MAG: glycosyltransferase [Bradyrhizobium sp.]|jgi:glycosyltransferase involved in cell wall biosynthesis